MIQLATTVRRRFLGSSDFRADVLRGLRAAQKWLPCKYFYDRRGSELFDEICRLPEYYLTRTELAIMREYADEMAGCIGRNAMLVELGSGSSEKTRLLLDHCADVAAYVPVDISGEYLWESADRLSQAHPKVRVLPICADFTCQMRLPRVAGTSKTVIYFPGSTIGNFTNGQALRLLKRIPRLCGSGGGLLIGIDLQKEAEIIQAAYNDARGVTAEFNLNLLARINEELDGHFDLDAFEHQAIYNSCEGRIEMRLVSRRRQIVAIGQAAIEFRPGEAVVTEYSHKYSIERFAAMAASAGLTLRKQWTDSLSYFAVLYFEAAAVGRLNGNSHTNGQIR
jgi:dimethylhistidine N-methyltransferase